MPVYLLAKIGRLKVMHHLEQTDLMVDNDKCLSLSVTEEMNPEIEKLTALVLSSLS